MDYRSIAHLNSDVRAWIERLPGDIDLFVGIPRSGSLVANLLAVHVNRPFTDVDGLMQGRIIAAGPSLRHQVDLNDRSRRLKLLVVDDVVWSGNQIRKVKERIKSAQLSHDIKYGAVYVMLNSSKFVDYYYKKLPRPHIFEWNVMKHEYLEQSCVDLDGVLCRDIRIEEDDDGPNYLKFLRDVVPLFLPNRKVGWIVTSRLEKYRPQTESWLSEHGVEYGELRMLELDSAEERAVTRASPRYKAAVYRETNARLFIESNEREAIEIARLAGRPVFCMDTREMIYPGVEPGRRQAPRFDQRLRWLVYEFRRNGLSGTLRAINTRVH